MRSENKNIILIEPSAIVRQGLRTVLQRVGYDVVAEYPGLEQLSGIIQLIDADVIIINPELIGDLKDTIKKLPVSAHIIPVALVYQYFTPQKLDGYHAILDVRITEENLAAMLDQLLSQNKTQQAAAASDYELTEREKDVLVLVAKGLMSKEIADKLNISIHTVITHRKNITRKTGIKSVAGLAVYAMLNNLIDNNEH